MIVTAVKAISRKIGGKTRCPEKSEKPVLG
jgi:hypothetical protein